MRKPHSILLIFITIIAGACTRHAPAIIDIDISRVHDVHVDSTRLITLEASDSSLIYDICSLEQADGKFFVHSRNLLRVFDSNTGSFLFNLTHRGTKPYEFSSIGNMWLDGDTLRIFDPNTARILSFMPDGTFCGDIHPFAAADIRDSERPRLYLPAPDGEGVITLNLSTGGSTPVNPLLTRYDKHHRYAGTVRGREVPEGAYMMDGYLCDTINRRLLIWEPLRDTIFTVTGSEISPLYTLNFIGREFPHAAQARYLSERIKTFTDMGSNAASFIRYIRVKGNKMLFCFLTGDQRSYLATYDMDNAKSEVYHFASADNRLQQTSFITIVGDTLLFEMKDTCNVEANPYIYKIPLTEIQ